MPPGSASGAPLSLPRQCHLSAGVRVKLGGCCSTGAKEREIVYQEDEFATCEDHTQCSDPHELNQSEEVPTPAPTVSSCVDATHQARDGMLSAIDACHAQEWAALDAFWDLVGEQPPDERTNDACLLRFLRARELNLEEAYRMWSKWVEWRAHFQVDNLTVHASQR